MLAQRGADELRLGTDEAPRMLQHGSPLRLSIPPTSDDMLRHLLEPLLTGEREDQLWQSGKVQMAYALDGGDSYAVSFQQRDAGSKAFTVIFRRDAGAMAKAAKPVPASAPSPPPVVEAPRAPTAAPATVADEVAPLSLALVALLQRAVSLRASDVHLFSGEPPSLRIDGRLQLASDLPALSVEQIFGGRLAEAAQAAGHSSDLALDVPSLGRFRVNLYRASDRLAAAIRVLMRAAPSLGELNLPVPLDDVINAPHGIVIVCGPTGSGKSATLSALAAEAVRRRSGLLISLEDPIEYIISAAPPALIRQRQVGPNKDVRDFPTGLRDALREDPDILLIGEMRDPETITLALTAAETGHLVLTSLHSRSAASSIERIVDAYPPERQQQIRGQLADALRVVISQRLVPRARGVGRLPAVEILRGNHTVASMIRDGKTAQLPSVLQSSRKEGMLPLERSLADMVRAGQITREHAAQVANDGSTLASYLQS
jgi:twitching motility protein PilT